MLDETHFRAHAGATLQHLNDQLEQFYDNEELEELDYDEGSGILSIETPKGQTFIVSRHEPSRQLWLASPILGGLHFDFCSETQDWILPDGRLLKALLSQDLQHSAGIAVRL